MILMFPVCEMRMFSILRSGKRCSECKSGCRDELTSVNNIVLVTVIKCTTNLPREFACDPLAQTTVTDDVVKHLATVDVLEDHVIVVLVNDHLAHAAYVRMVEEHGEGRFSECASLFGSILGGLLGRRLRVGGCCDTAGTLRSDAWEDLDSELQ